MKNFYLSLFIFFLANLAQAEISEGVFFEIAQFKSEKKLSLPDDYVHFLPNHILELMKSSEKNLEVKNKSTCTDSMSIEFINSLTGSNNPAVQSFESGLIKIDVSKCLRNSVPAKVIELTTSSEFNKKAISAIKTSVRTGNRFCETTSASFVGRSSYCYKVFVDESNDRYIKGYSFNEWNDPNPDYNMKVFLRAGHVSARQIQNDTLYHLITYIRGPKLNAVEKFFAKSVLEKSQKETFQKLQDELH